MDQHVQRGCGGPLTVETCERCTIVMPAARLR
jgi:hypothetical protein